MHFLMIFLFLCSYIFKLAQCFEHLNSPARHAEARRIQSNQHQRKSYSNLGERQANYKFLNNDTKSYLVSSMPEVKFDLGEMYSGSIPIDLGDDSRSLFFLFYPKIGDSVDEVTIWLNGGPGCSSLTGFLQENGPVLWQPGTLAPIPNPYTWTNLTNMIWVDQPVGTGYSVGTPTATTQEETAQDFIKFFKNFQKLFGIKNFKIYVTGESYAGRYVPYISSAMLDANDTEYYNVSGALVYDPCIGEFVSLGEQYTVTPFALKNNNILNLEPDTLATVEHLHESCGYADYIDKYYTFPPSGVQPPLYFNFSDDKYKSCDVYDAIFAAALEKNNCFNYYEITNMCPMPASVLAFPAQFLVNVYDQVYFNRTDVKEALHAPMDVDWTICSFDPVFVGNDTAPGRAGDTSADPIQYVLPRVIEATNRVLVSNGDYDMNIITNGTLLSIQNMTWNGKLGFQDAPSTPINITIPDLQYTQIFVDNDFAGFDGPQGIMGVQHFERGLMWAETFQAGHQQPAYQPRVTYRHLEWVLGRTDSL